MVLWKIGLNVNTVLTLYMDIIATSLPLSLQLIQRTGRQAFLRLQFRAEFKAV